MPPKIETIELTRGPDKGEDIKFKEGTLHKQLKVGKDYKFKKGELMKIKKMKPGAEFDFHGKKFKKTPLLSKRVDLAITLMGFKKKK